MKNQTLFLLTILCCIGKISIAQTQDSASLYAATKEAYIQKAIALRKQENYLGAVQQLDSILEYNAKDASVLLFKGDLLLQARKFGVAAATYKQLLPLHFENTIAKINLSYALFMNHQPMLALGYARAAWQQDKTNASAVINYFNAMLWNIQTKQAAAFLKANYTLLSPAQQLVLQARLQTTSGNYKAGLQYYDSLINSYADKYYVQEYAEVLLGKKEVARSAAAVNAAKEMFSLSEYAAYRQKLQAAKQQNAGTEFVYFKDVANNVRTEQSVWWQLREQKMYRLRFSAGRASLTSQQKEKTNTRFAHVNITERFGMAFTGETDVHLQVIQPANSKGFTALSAKQTLQYKPNDRRMFGVVAGTDVLSFSATVLQKNIRVTELGYVTHIMPGGKTGIYSQGSYGKLSDGNKRLVFFGSLYHVFRTEPTLKGGLNFSALHYRDNAVKNYFSPNRYINTETFVDYSTALPGLSKFYMQLQAAAGMQKIETQNWDAALRFQTELGFRTKHFETALKYQTSNVASNTGTGYKFNWYTLRLIWKW